MTTDASGMRGGYSIRLVMNEKSSRKVGRSRSLEMPEGETASSEKGTEHIEQWCSL